MSDARGKYRIQTVADMTGVPAATLRAWERRYGIPIPARTASAYRLYSDGDIGMIRRVRELCDSGMSPSEATRLVLDEQTRELDSAAMAVVPSEDAFGPMRTAILTAIDNLDVRRLERELDRATALGTATTIVDQVLRPVMLEVGDAWHAGSMSVAQEHLATEAVTAVARRLLALVQPDGDARIAVLGVFADDEHMFPLLALGIHAAAWGWRVVLLGARTPPAAIKHVVEAMHPGLVGLSCTVSPVGHRARELTDAYADAVGDTPWLVGGSGAADIAKFVVARGGHVTDESRPSALRPVFERAAASRSTRK
jgi:DNA-binding transcriptional MerR regulator